MARYLRHVKHLLVATFLVATGRIFKRVKQQKTLRNYARRLSRGMRTRCSTSGASISTVNGFRRTVPKH